MGKFGSKYSKTRHTKNYGKDPTTKKRIVRHQEKNSIVQHEVDDIILQKRNNLSAEAEAHNNIESKIVESNLYEIDNISINEKKEKTEWCKYTF